MIDIHFDDGDIYGEENETILEISMKHGNPKFWKQQILKNQEIVENFKKLINEQEKTLLKLLSPSQRSILQKRYEIYRKIWKEINPNA